MDTMAVRLSRLRVRTVGVVLTALLVSGAMLLPGSYAAFTSTATNPANSWSAGTVMLSNDGTGAVFATVSGLKPDDGATRCIAVTYQGTLASTVRLYATGGSATGDIGPYLDLIIEEGTGGSFAGCTGFSGSLVYAGTVADFAATRTGFSTGVGTFAPATGPTTEVYRITYALRNDANGVGRSGGIGFTWQAQNT